MDKIDNWIAFAGVIVSVFFNYLLWKVSQKSAEAANKSADVAQKSLEFMERQKERDEIEFNFAKKIFYEKVKKDTEYIRDAVQGQGYPNHTFNSSTIQIAKAIQLPSPYEMSRFFTEQQQQIIDEVWSKFLRYYSLYWFDGNKGEFSCRFSNEDGNTLRTISTTIGNEIKELLKEL